MIMNQMKGPRAGLLGCLPQNEALEIKEVLSHQ